MGESDHSFPHTRCMNSTSVSGSHTRSLMIGLAAHADGVPPNSVPTPQRVWIALEGRDLKVNTLEIHALCVGGNMPGWAKKSVVAVLVVGLLWLGASYWYFSPRDHSDPPLHSDAIVLLGGDRIGMQEGFKLLDRGYGDVLVLFWYADALEECREGYRGHEVLCLQPLPVTTQGEAMAIGELAKDRRWQTVTVATWPRHIIRSRFLVERCYSGELRWYETPYPYEVPEQISQSWHESFGMVKAAVSPGCSTMLPLGWSE